MQRIFITLLGIFLLFKSVNLMGQTQPNHKFGVLIEHSRLRPISGSDSNAAIGARYRIIGLKHFDDYSLGMGFGLDGYASVYGFGLYAAAPAVVDFRYYGFKRFTPFGSIGVAVPIGDPFKTGPLFAVGVTANLIPKRQWLKASLGYNYQRFNNADGENEVTESSLTYGLVFSLWN